MFSRTSLLAFLIAILVTLVCFKSCSVFAEHNGFDLSGSLIPSEQILAGGPARDGIPSIDEPEFIAAMQAGGWQDDQQVLSLTVGGITRAYPIYILNWHEIVNDNIGGQSVVISYCPLCGTGMAFSADINGEALTFGVSGLLYNSDVLLYDRQSDSLWSQLKSQAVTGKFKGQKLTQLPLNQMTWKEWKARYPDGEVLSRNTGYSRDYSQSPYGGYDESPVLYFPVEFRSQAYHPKERVLGVEVDGKFKAYPFAELSKISNNELLDDFNGQQFKLIFNASSRTGEVVDAETGIAYPAVNSFWFAWYTFHPDTDVYKTR